MTRRTDVVVTTIFEPQWLDGYLQAIEDNDQKDWVTLRIICDRKTPDSVASAAAQAQARGFAIDCPSLQEQEDYLHKLGLAEDFIPWNTDNRRNIGFLRAWESGAEVMISIDDDNYTLPGSDFIGEHAVVGQSSSACTDAQVADAAPWFNICERLELNTPAAVFARGFPYAARDPRHCAPLRARHGDDADRMIAVNAGLWIDDPDVDALSRLALAPRARQAQAGAVILGPATWSPINTQNTALVRDAIPAYYYLRMGFPLQGLKIDRFGDILSGYFMQKCTQHLQHAIRIGSPVAEHRRSPHNLFKDLYHELAGIVLIEELLPWLMELRIEGDDYRSAYRSLAAALAADADRFTGFVWDEGGRQFLRETAACMNRWLDTIDRLG